jgi:phosphate uptake regulator
MHTEAKFTTEDCLNPHNPSAEVELPGLEAIAQQKFDLPYYELSPALQSHVREERVRRSGQNMLAALKTVVDVLANRSRGPELNSLSTFIDDVVREAEGK